MAKKQIHEQSQALSAYFTDMLTTPPATPPATATDEEKPAAVTSKAITTAPEPSVDIDTKSLGMTERPKSLRVLLCDIAEITLAVPVSELNNIVRWPEHGLTAAPEQTGWQLGVINQPQATQVIDIRHLLKPETPFAPIQANYIIIVGGHRWGIACDRIQHIVTYQTEAINWDDEQSQSPWCMAVTSDAAYPIIDIPSLLLTVEQS